VKHPIPWQADAGFLFYVAQLFPANAPVESSLSKPRLDSQAHLVETNQPPDIACHPDPHRGRHFPKFRDSLSCMASKLRSKKGFISGCGFTATICFSSIHTS
jgi:hypothetical protein